MLTITLVLSSIILAVLKYFYPTDFPAYVIVIPLMFIGLFFGVANILKLGFKMLRDMGNMSIEQDLQKAFKNESPTKSNYQPLSKKEKAMIKENTDGNLTDITSIIKERKKPKLQIVPNNGDDIA